MRNCQRSSSINRAPLLTVAVASITSIAITSDTLLRFIFIFISLSELLVPFSTRGGGGISICISRGDGLHFSFGLLGDEFTIRILLFYILFLVNIISGGSISICISCGDGLLFSFGLLGDEFTIRILLFDILFLVNIISGGSISICISRSSGVFFLFLRLVDDGVSFALVT